MANAQRTLMFYVFHNVLLWNFNYWKFLSSNV